MTVSTPNFLKTQFFIDNVTQLITPAQQRQFVDSVFGLPVGSTQIASYVAQAVDVGTVTHMNLTGTANNFTIPLNASVPGGIDVNAMFGVRQIGTGTTTIQAAGGVTVNVCAPASLVLRGQWALAFIHKIGTDLWVAFGDLT